MTHDEAERLALIIKDGLLPTVLHSDLAKLCDHILSGDMKREIENAAFERAAQIVMSCQSSKLCTNATIIRSLIQPLAQRGNVK